MSICFIYSLEYSLVLSGPIIRRHTKMKKCNNIARVVTRSYKKKLMQTTHMRTTVVWKDMWICIGRREEHSRYERPRRLGMSVEDLYSSIVPTELSAVMEMFAIYTVQYNSH